MLTCLVVRVGSMILTAMYVPTASSAWARLLQIKSYLRSQSYLLVKIKKIDYAVIRLIFSKYRHLWHFLSLMNFSSNLNLAILKFKNLFKLINIHYIDSKVNLKAHLFFSCPAHSCCKCICGFYSGFSMAITSTLWISVLPPTCRCRELPIRPVAAGSAQLPLGLP